MIAKRKGFRETHKNKTKQVTCRKIIERRWREKAFPWSVFFMVAGI